MWTDDQRSRDQRGWRVCEGTCEFSVMLGFRLVFMLRIGLFEDCVA